MLTTGLCFVLPDSEVGDERRDRHHSEIDLDSSRITSYNVCYTKLLRFPNRDTLIRSMTIPIEREGYHSLTYTQKQSQDLIQKQNADTTVTDSIIRRVKTFNLSANSKYIAYTFYDTTITELINMNWNEWKEYRTTKVYRITSYNVCYTKLLRV